MDRCNDIEEKLGRELNDREIEQLRLEVDRHTPRIFKAKQLVLELHRV